MDADETAIIEEYGSSLEDLTFNSKPLINVLTMLAEENSKYGGSVTKLIEERIYKVPQQHKLPSLYLLDSIIKNVGGDYLNLIAQVLVKVFATVFEKGDEKVRRDLYKLRHTWPQYFSAKVLHEVDVNVNKMDNGWPISAIPPPSPSIHINPKFLKKAEVSVPQIAAPEIIKEDEQILLLEQKKRLAELQRLQEEQLRLTEQEIQEHQMKRDLILKKQEQERKAFLTQQQQIILTLRLGNIPGDQEETSMPTSSSSAGVKPVLTEAETTQSRHGTTMNRDPRLRHKDQTPSLINNNQPRHPRPDARTEHKIEKSKSPRFVRKDLDIHKGDMCIGRGHDAKTQGTEQPSDGPHGTKRRSRSQSPLDGREKKHQRPDRDAKTESERSARAREDARTKRRRSLEDDKGVEDFKNERSDRKGPEKRNFRGRGNNGREREWNGRSERELKPGFERNPREGRGGMGRGGMGRGGMGRGGMGRGEVSKLRFKRRQAPAEEQHAQPCLGKDTIAQEDPHPLVKPKQLLTDNELGSIRCKEPEGEPEGEPGSDTEFATVPHELTLEHKSVILDEAKRRLDMGLISQDQYIELIDKLAEFYELQRKQELEAPQIPDVQTNKQNIILPEKQGCAEIEKPQRNQNKRGRERKAPARKRGPQMDGPRHPPRDGPSRRGPRMEEPFRREGPGMMGGPGRMTRPPLMVEEENMMDGPDTFEGPPRPSRRMRMEEPHLINEVMDPHHMRMGPPRREGSPRRDMPGPPTENGPWRTVDHDRVPPLHDLGPPNHHRRFPEGPHPMDEGHPVQFIPPGRDTRDFRGTPMEDFHGGPPRSFEEPFPGEPHRPPESFGHGRPMDQFQGHPMGPGHHGQPQGPPHGPQQGTPHGPPQGLPHGPPQGLPQGPPHGPPQGLHHGPPLQQIQMPGSPLRQGTGTPPLLSDPPTPSRMDKRTVDDLFSRLIHAGIINKVTEERMADTPPRIGTPPMPIQAIHPGQPIPTSQPGHMVLVPQPLRHPIPKPIMSSGQAIVPFPGQGAPFPRQVAPVVSTRAKSSLNLLQKMIEKSKENASKIPYIGLKIGDLKKRHIGIISMLYEGTQCSSCGLRFAGEAAAFYREHLDWHFRRNRREKDGRRIAHNKWYIPLKDWLDYEEITDPEEKAHSSFFDSEKPESAMNENKNAEGEGSCPVLLSDGEAETKCDICQEKFESFWEEVDEEWRYKDAIRINGKTYHDLCYQDAKSTHVEETDPEADTSRETTSGESPRVKKEETETSDKIPKPEVKEDQSSVKIKQESIIGEVNSSKEENVSKEEVLNDKNILNKEKVVFEGEMLSPGEIKVEDPSTQHSENSAKDSKDEEKNNKIIEDTGSISVDKAETTHDGEK